jgi:hypothetical protein
MGFRLADPLCGEITAQTQIWRATRDVMRVCRQNLNKSLIEHALGPVSGFSTEGAS